MKTILNSRRNRYLAKFSIFLIIVALIAGMVGCDGPQYNLTISSSTTGGPVGAVGGNVTATSEEERVISQEGEEKTIFGIPEGTVVNLTATPHAGYRFDRWTGGMVTIANVSAAETTITMNTTYSITAEFVWGLEIQDWYGLNATRTPNNLAGSHILMNDLDSTSANYTELAGPTANGGDGWKPILTFTGSFDGQGYEIRDLYINRPTEDYVGLFGYVEGGVVQNVTVVNANVTGEDYVGGLVGKNRGTVSDSTSTGSVTGENYVGGVVGWNGGDVLDSNSSGNVTGGNQYVGGLVGWNEGTVSSSNSTGNVTGSNDYVGGLVGWNQKTVSSSNSTGNVTGSNDYVGGLVGLNKKGGSVSTCYFTGSVSGRSQVGGVAGNNSGTVSKSYSSSNVTGNDENVGGLVGWNGGTVSHSHSTGNVAAYEYVGGLVGWNEGTVQEDSYSSGNAEGTDNIGGLVGFNNYGGTVSHSHSTGNVTGTDNVGGLVGWNEGTVEANSYSSSNVSGGLCVGGLVGWNARIPGYSDRAGAVSSSNFTGSVTGDDWVGGLVGYNEGTVAESCSTGSVTGSLSSSRRVGGLVGNNKAGKLSVSDSYSIGNVSGYQYVGGLVGFNEQSFVENCYSIGKVTGTRDVGGLVGKNKGTVTNSFWDIQTSGRDPSPKPEEYGTGKTMEEMKNIETFTGAEWDIVPVGSTRQRITAHIWNIVDGETYPFLSWQP